MLRILPRRVYRDIDCGYVGLSIQENDLVIDSQILKGCPSPCLQTSFIQPHKAVVTRQNPDVRFLP